MTIILTNDDGFEEPGLSALRLATLGMGETVIVAPDSAQSLVGHRVTMRGPIAFDKRGPEKYAIDGSPADCTRVALKILAPEAQWVLAGINPGANLGSDVYQSGTVAAARESAILGVKSIAISHYIGPGEKIDWHVASQVVRPLLEEIMSHDIPPGSYLNINLPSPLTLETKVYDSYCPLDIHPHRYDYILKNGMFEYRGIIHDRPRAAGSDVDICFSGKVSITLLQL